MTLSNLKVLLLSTLLVKKHIFLFQNAEKTRKIFAEFTMSEMPFGTQFIGQTKFWISIWIYMRAVPHSEKLVPPGNIL